MEKSPVPDGGGDGGNGVGLPPHSSRFPASCSPTASSSSQLPSDSDHFGHPAPSECRLFSHDVSRMPDFPPRNPGHRRAHSEILSLPDDISFDSDLGVVGSNDGPSLSDEAEEDLVSMFMDGEKFGSVAATAGLSNGGEGPSTAEAKKAISAAKLAELALVDPKRAKRILANRQSAARSKERKMRYIAELERQVHTFQTEATTLSAQLTMLQRDNNGLTAENSELKLRLQTMEQQVHLQDALNEALREEVQHLKLATVGSLDRNGSCVVWLSPIVLQNLNEEWCFGLFYCATSHGCAT
ncbi:hypothetical protein OPV22_004978 [Ensete ventricosum]|uniref:BZIP domain-containing protein n=1 Tax=Ensete ventricosum TaxID=4639 RepID=A0AAV8RHV2_ENSVE|nr:hypothetical protein OPV22_004978 [Ensete ventricosum]